MQHFVTAPRVIVPLKRRHCATRSAVVFARFATRFRTIKSFTEAA